MGLCLTARTSCPVDEISIFHREVSSFRSAQFIGICQMFCRWKSSILLIACYTSQRVSSIPSPVGNPVGAIEQGVEEVMESWTHYLQSLSSESLIHAPASPMHGTSSSVGLEQHQRRIEAETALARLLVEEGMHDQHLAQGVLNGLLDRMHDGESSQSEVNECKSSFM